MNDLTDVELQTCGARQTEQESKLSAFFAKWKNSLPHLFTKLTKLLGTTRLRPPFVRPFSSFFGGGGLYTARARAQPPPPPRLGRAPGSGEPGGPRRRKQNQGPFCEAFSRLTSTCPLRVRACACACAGARVGVAASVVYSVLVLGNMGIPWCCEYVRVAVCCCGCVGVPGPSATCMSYVGLGLRSVDPSGSPFRERGASDGVASLPVGLSAPGVSCGGEVGCSRSSNAVSIMIIGTGPPVSRPLVGIVSMCGQCSSSL
jgi:hypothetical protein